MQQEQHLRVILRPTRDSVIATGGERLLIADVL
ncbi:hypothetical protein ACVWYO_001537 [Sphingomonas sp. UYP23]